MVEKIAELDLELSEGDITQKGYEKKKTKLLAPFLRENQVNNTKSEEQKNGVKAKPRQTNGSSHQPSSSSSSSATPSAPPAPQADSSQASGASGMSDSSGKNKHLVTPWECFYPPLLLPGLSVSGQESVLSQQNKPRSRRTHRRYYNEKRFDAPHG